MFRLNREGRSPAKISMAVAGGEQDTNMHIFRMMVERRVVDIIQPDFWYNGGFIRALRVAAMAGAAGIDITPHSPQWGPGCAVKFHLAAIAPNAGRFQEHRAGRKLDWCTPSFAIEDGVVPMLTGPGWGVDIDPDFMKAAEVVLKS